MQNNSNMQKKKIFLKCTDYKIKFKSFLQRYCMQLHKHPSVQSLHYYNYHEFERNLHDGKL